MATNRLLAMGGVAAAPEKDEPASGMSAHLAKYQDIKKGLKTIERNTANLKHMLGEVKKLARPEDLKEKSTQMGGIIDQTGALATRVKQNLDKIAAEDKAFAEEEEKAGRSRESRNIMEMRANVFDSNTRAFRDTMNEYTEQCKASKAEWQGRQRRQLEMVSSNTAAEGLTKQKIDELLEDPARAEQVIKSAMIGDISDLARDETQRYDQILTLERQVAEVFEMFKDLNTLVELQGERLEVISSHVDDALENFKDAQKVLIEAEQHQKSARSWKCYAMIILMVVLCVVIGIIAGTGAFKKA